MLVLICGGAGFIGGHLAKELLDHGYEVRVLDNLVPQVHGPERKRPDYLSQDVELVVDDVRNPNAIEKALQGAGAVVNLAGLVGVGQSMYQISEYMGVNTWGTANLLDAVSTRNIESMVVASSMSIYGEGLYRNNAGEISTARQRTIEQLRSKKWEVEDDRGEPLHPVATPETKQPSLASVYALSKYDQERLSLLVGGAYGIRTCALRFFNTYGPNQALSNPYTGVLSNFASRVLNGQAPLIYEDGLQKRDFVSVYDVARACRLALETPRASGLAMNISSGQAMTVAEAATRTVRALGRTDIEPEITGKYRAGDIRHCFADISLAKEVMGWSPLVSLEDGLQDLANWLEGQTAVDRALEARSELAARGLMV